MTAFRAAGATDSGNSQAATLSTTLPVSLHGGDVVIIAGEALPVPAAATTLSLTSSGTAPSAIGTPITGTESIASTTLAAFKIVCAGTPGNLSSDAGATITLHSTTSAYLAVAHGAYSGADPAAVDVMPAGAFGGANTAIVTAPVVATQRGADWAIAIGAGASEGGDLGTPAGLTSRASTLSAVNVAVTIADSNGPAGPIGTSIGGGTFTAPSSTNSLLCAYTIGLRQQFTPALSSTEGSGVQDWAIPSDICLPATLGSTASMRVLVPSSPAAGVPHRFLVALPVDEGFHSTTFGNAIDVILAQGWHNSLNLTVVEPQWGIQSWCADNPLDGTVQLESHVQLLAQWLPTSALASGGESISLIGFSKTGIGALGLAFHQPGLFARVGVWDYPGEMTAYDGTDPNGVVGGDPADNYGTDASFQASYRLSTGNLARWAGPFTASQRVFSGGWHSFELDVAFANSALSTAGIQANTTLSTDSGSHAWLTSWMSLLLAWMYPALSSPGLLMAAGII